MTAISYAELTGRSETHLAAWRDGQLLHRGVPGPLQQMCESAREAGIELAVASAYRSYDRQLSIWRDKVAGKRPLIAADGQLLSPEALSGEQVLRAILRWSALPGLSRHHWGTDLDVFDRQAVASDYKLQLCVEEYAPGGPFAALSQWLQERAAGFGFFRPYAEDHGGVAPEPWHISYRPLADEYAGSLNFAVFERLLGEDLWPLGAEIRASAASIYQRYVCNSPSNDGNVSL